MSEKNSNGIGINNLRDIGGKKTSENKTTNGFEAAGGCMTFK